MLHYAGIDILFQEVPDEVSLSFTVAGCPNGCDDCHWVSFNKIASSDFPRLTAAKMVEEYKKYDGLVTCVLFFGGDWELSFLESMIEEFTKHRDIEIIPKFALYSGQEPANVLTEVNTEIWDYVKAGPYKREHGGLKKKTTNQIIMDVKRNKDITYKFWK